MFVPSWLLVLAAVVAVTSTVEGFSLSPFSSSMIRPTTTSSSSRATVMALHMAEQEKQVESAFMPPEEASADDDDDDDEEIPLDKVETLGRGAAKVSLKIIRECGEVPCKLLETYKMSFFYRLSRLNGENEKEARPLLHP